MAAPPIKKSLPPVLKIVLAGLVFWSLDARCGFPLGEVLARVRAIEPARFPPWIAFAQAVKVLGIFADVRRWQFLLREQALPRGFGFRPAPFFVGRFLGIVAPGTRGLDGFKLYDAIRVTRMLVECAAVIAIDKVIGLVSLTAWLVVVFPVGWTRVPTLDPAKAVIVGLEMLAASSAFFAVLLALGLTRPTLRLVPSRAGPARTAGTF